MKDLPEKRPHTRDTRYLGEVRQMEKTLKEAQEERDRFYSLTPKEQDDYVGTLTESLQSVVTVEAFKEMLQNRVRMWEERISNKKKEDRF